MALRCVLPLLLLATGCRCTGEAPGTDPPRAPAPPVGPVTAIEAPAEQAGERLEALCAELVAQDPECSPDAIGPDARCMELHALEPGSQRLEQVSTLSLGAPLEQKAIAPPADADLDAIGLQRETWQRWSQALQELGVHRVERWRVQIEDEYHGQPGLVVRTDHAFLVPGGWLVCPGQPSGLGEPLEPVPPEGLVCERVFIGGRRWFRCGAAPPEPDRARVEDKP